VDSNLKEMLDYYRSQGAPNDQQMLIALLKEAQESDGGVLKNHTLSGIAEAYDLKPSVLMALIRRISSLRYEDVPHSLEVCRTCKCNPAIRDYIENEIGIGSGSASRELGFSYRLVNCMKNCKNGPSIKWDGVLYSHATIDLLKKLTGNI